MVVANAKSQVDEHAFTSRAPLPLSFLSKIVRSHTQSATPVLVKTSISVGAGAIEQKLHYIDFAGNPGDTSYIKQEPLEFENTSKNTILEYIFPTRLYLIITHNVERRVHENIRKNEA